MEFGDKMTRITENLNLSEKVRFLNGEDHLEAGVIAHGLLDIEESASAISNKILPVITGENLTEIEVEIILFELGEELKHILYHINEMRYFHYLKNYLG